MKTEDVTDVTGPNSGINGLLEDLFEDSDDPMRYITYSKDALKKTRKALGIASQQQFTDELNELTKGDLSLFTVQKWEQGVNEPSQYWLGEIGRLFTMKAAAIELDPDIPEDRKAEWMRENKIRFVSDWQ